MSDEQIAATIREAYRNAETVGKSQEGRRLLRGSADGLDIEMWINVRTRQIETAYPV